jgi:hypothetical protein
VSYPKTVRIEMQEDMGPELRIVGKRNGAPNGAAKKNVARMGGRLQRTELAALGWEARRRRLEGLK